MKKLITILFLIIAVQGRAQYWYNAGAAGFSGVYSDNISLVLGDSTPYVAYRDVNNTYDITVKKFNGNNWVNVGTSNLANEGVDYFSLAMRGSTPYVAYMDYNMGGASVKKFDGTNWVFVGTPGFSGFTTENVSLSMMDTVPYIALMDENKGGVSVMKFDSSHWVTVGAPAFSNGFADNISLTNANDTLYVAYMDYNKNGITVKKFNGTSWVTVGIAGFSAMMVDKISLVESNGILYVAYRDYNFTGNATVKKFNGTAWVDVGSPTFSGYTDYMSLAVKDSVPYVAYQDNYNGYGTSVKKFDGTNWLYTGTPGFTNGQADNMSLLIKDTVPYVAYMDYNSNGISVSHFQTNPADTIPATGLKFDGADDYVNCGNSPGINNLGRDGFTLEAWVKVSNPAATNSIIRKTGDYNLYVNANTINVEYWPNGVGNSVFKKLSGTITIAANTWTHVAATWDGTTISLYTNGVLNNGASITTVVGGSENMWLGRSSIYGNIFSGSMDEVKVWNRALCQSEIQNNMTGEIDPAQQTGLMAYYRFNQGIIGANNAGLTTATDVSGNGNNGTLNNFSLMGQSSNWGAGIVSGNAPVYTPATLSATAGGAQVCQPGTVPAAGTYYIDGSCKLIAHVTPSGASPVSGTINTCVKIDGSVQFYGGHPYVQRHYDITPATNAATATGTITLFYTQAEFDAYNLVRGVNPALPTSAADAAGIANLLVTQYHGTGTAPGNYSGAAVLINPADNNIVWNNTYSRWEITFDVSGFSGFYVYTNPGNVVLPLRLFRFIATKQINGNLLQWQTSNEINFNKFIIERSSNGSSFNSIGSLPAKRIDNASYSFSDSNSYAGNIFYRLKMEDNDGKFSYSNIVRLNNQPADPVTVYPNPVEAFIVVQANDKKLIGTTAKIIDMSGKAIKTFIIDNNLKVVDMAGLSAGVYLLQTVNGAVQKIVKK